MSDQASAPAARRPWGAFEGLLALASAIGATIFVSVPALAIGDDTGTAKVVGNVLTLLLQNVVFVGVPVLILVVTGQRLRRGDLGLRRPSRPWVALGLLVGGAVAYLLLSNGLAHLLGVADEQDDLPNDLGVDVSTAAAIAIGLCTTVLAPIGEEALLRGVVYPGLRTTFAKVGPRWLAIAAAAIVDGLLFGALHAAGTDVGFLPILALFGTTLCLLYQATGSLYVPIALHATNNTVAIAGAADWSVGQGVALWVTAMLVLGALAAAVGRVDVELRPPGTAT